MSTCLSCVSCALGFQIIWCNSAPIISIWLLSSRLVALGPTRQGYFFAFTILSFVNHHDVNIPQLQSRFTRHLCHVCASQLCFCCHVSRCPSGHWKAAPGGQRASGYRSSLQGKIYNSTLTSFLGKTCTSFRLTFSTNIWWGFSCCALINAISSCRFWSSARITKKGEKQTQAVGRVGWVEK